MKDKDQKDQKQDQNISDTTSEEFFDECDEDCAEQEGKLIYSGVLFTNEKSN